MKRILKYIIVFSFLLFFGCTDSNKDSIPVKSLDQIGGIWQWESTCGGVILNCSYPSRSNNAAIVFTSNGEYIEYQNDTIALQTDYSLEKTDVTHGTLILGGSYHDSYYNLPVTVANNRLEIFWGEIQKTYTKIK
jgi:hypothetical protein